MKTITLTIPFIATILNEEEADKRRIESCYQTEIKCKYTDLVKLLGKATYKNGDEYKTLKEWVIQVGNDIVTVYDYKESKKYCGSKDGLNLNEITNWHIGGNNNAVSMLVARYILDNK